MKSISLPRFLLLLLAILGAFLAQPAPAQTQAEMHREASADYKKADAAMNRVYKRLMAKYEEDEDLQEKLKVAQRAWIAFRDAQADLEAGGGTLRATAYATTCAELTRTRTEALQALLDQEN